MATKVTFDWDNLLIIVNNGITELDVQVDLYSDWKEDVQLSDNSKYPIAFRTVGGDPISDTQNLGATYFLLNNWKIRPFEGDHELLITGNIFTDPFGDAIAIPTLGDFTVLITNKVSNLVDSSVSRLDLTQINPAVYIDDINGSPGTEEGKGTPTNPVDNFTDAAFIAARDNLSTYRVRGSFTLDQDYINWTFESIGSEVGTSLNFGGFDVNQSLFKRVTLTGTMQGRADFENCQFVNITDFDGISRGCGLDTGTIALANNSVVIFSNCFSEVAGTNTPVIDAGTNVELSVRNYSGGIKLDNFTSGCVGTLGLDPGHAILDSTCIGGILVVRGVGKLTDNSAGTAVTKDGLVEPTDVRLTRQILANKLETDPDTGILTLYDDDGSVLATAQLYEDVTAVQKYQGKGAERREKLT